MRDGSTNSAGGTAPDESGPGGADAEDDVVERLIKADSFDGSIFGSDQPCFGCSPSHPFGFRLTFRRDGDSVVTRFTPNERHQGPPGIMHGGLVAALADEIAAWAILSNIQKFGFTTSIECRLKKPLRIGMEIEGRGSLLKATARVVQTEVTLSQGGEERASADLRFILVDEKGAEAMLGKPLPKKWRRFAFQRSP